MLSTNDHSRDSAGLTYVYPVLSRRSGGLSIGINLNPNNACNWRCIYCQVPDLVRGNAPAIDLTLLEQELSGFLQEVLQGDFFERQSTPQELRVIRDIALSGNGESTSAAEFEQVIGIIGRQMRQHGLPGSCKLVLITNGSLAHQPHVQNGIRAMNELNGEVWFKLDSASDEGIRCINNAAISIERVQRNLATVASLCPTWIQTCLFQLDGQSPGLNERQHYVGFLRNNLDESVPIKGILLYGIARPSMQAEASQLSPLPASEMQAWASAIQALGLEVRVNL